MEVMEHVHDDIGLLQKLRRSLRPSGLIIMTAPCKASVLAAARTRPDVALVSTVEDGSHVRVGYTPDDIASLAAKCNLAVSTLHWISRTSDSISSLSLGTRLTLTWPIISRPAGRRRDVWTADPARDTEYHSIGAVLHAVD
jgi:hypothetical protein